MPDPRHRHGCALRYALRVMCYVLYKMRYALLAMCYVLYEMCLCPVYPFAMKKTCAIIPS